MMTTRLAARIALALWLTLLGVVGLALVGLQPTTEPFPWWTPALALGQAVFSAALGALAFSRRAP